MKFDTLKWSEVDGQEFKAQSDLLQIMSNRKVAVFVTSQGVEALAGVGYEVQKTVKSLDTIRVEVLESAKGARVFYHAPMAVSYVPRGEVHTNIDRKPMESGMLLEVTKAVRQFRMEQKNALAELRAEKAALRQADPSGEPERQPDPAPEPEPSPEPPLERAPGVEAVAPTKGEVE